MKFTRFTQITIDELKNSPVRVFFDKKLNEYRIILSEQPSATQYATNKESAKTKAISLHHKIFNK